MRLINSKRVLNLLTPAACALLLVVTSGCSREAKKARHLERADQYFKAQDYAKAELEYLNVLRLDPANATAARQLGFALYEQGRYPQAFMFLEKALLANTNDVALRTRLAFGALLSRNLPKAREEALFILSRQPTNEEAFVLLADSVHQSADLQKTRQILETYREQAGNTAGFHLASGLLALRANELTAAEVSFKEAVRVNPNSAAAHATLGNFYMRQKKAELAEASLKTAAEVAPVRSPIALSYADFKVKQGNLDEGRKLLEGITQKAPDYFPAWNRLAEIAFSQKEYDSCASLLKSILEQDPANFEAQFLRARMKLARGELSDAITELQRLGTIFPKVPQVQYQLAVAHLANRDPGSAATRVNEAITLDPSYADAIILRAELDLRKADYAAAIAALSELIKKEPNLVHPHVLLAAAHFGRRDYPAAFAEYQMLASAFPRNPLFVLRLGDVHLQQKNTNAARQAFEQATALDQNYYPPLERLIDIDLNSGQFANAFDRLQARIGPNPTNAPLQRLLARVHLARKDTNAAEQAMLTAMKINPDDHGTYIALAQFYVQTGRHSEAIERLNAVLAKQPQDLAAHLQIAAIHDQVRNFSAARDHYEKILQIKPDLSAALNNLAYLYSEHLNQLDRAFELAKKARDVLPGSPATADTLGWILYKRGEFQSALALLEESVQALPDEPEVCFHLGMVYYALGQEKAALSQFEKALQAQREFPGKAESQQRVAILRMDPAAPDAKTIQEMETLLQKQPSDPILLARLGRIYDESGQLEKAAPLHEAALKQNPNNLGAMVKLAQFYAGAGKNPQKAMELLKKARTLTPNDPQVGHTLGRLAFQSGDHKWSLSLLQETARLKPNDPHLAYDLAWTHFALGQLREAETALNKVLQSDGGEANLKASAKDLLFWVPLCADLEKVRTSGIDLEDAVREKPDSLPAQFFAAWLLRQKGDFKAAQAAFESLLTRFPSFAPANKELASLYTEHLNDDQKALEHALKAREAYRQDPEVAKTLGIISYKRGDFRRSADLLKESAARRDSDAEVQFYVGMAHYKLNQKQESREALTKAVALDATGRFGSEAKKTLVQLQ